MITSMGEHDREHLVARSCKADNDNSHTVLYHTDTDTDTDKGKGKRGEDNWLLLVCSKE